MSDADELEREAEAARARLADTADQIRARMSPGQMMDEVLNQFRGGDGSQMLVNLRNQARDNPMALALIGGGLAWLMMGSGPDTSRRSSSVSTSPRPLGAGYPPSGASYPPPGASVGEGTWVSGSSGSRSSVGTSSSYGGSSSLGGSADSDSSTDSGSSSGIGASVSGLAQGASDAISSAGGAVGDRLHKAGDQAGEWARGLHAAGSGALSSAAHGVSDAAHGVRHSAADLGQQARNGFLDILEREPLVIGALGVAVGAAIGALLPATELERQHLAPAGEALKDKASALVDQGVSGAKKVAAEVYETARDEADRQGLLPGDTPIAEKIDAVVRAAGETVSTSVERQVSKVSENAEDAENPDGAENPGGAGNVGGAPVSDNRDEPHRT